MHITPYFLRGHHVPEEENSTQKAGINTNTGNLPDLFPHPEGEACPS